MPAGRRGTAVGAHLLELDASPVFGVTEPEKVTDFPTSELVELALSVTTA